MAIHGSSLLAGGTAAAAIALALVPAPAAARQRNYVLAYASVLDLSDPLETRTTQGAFVNVYTDSDVGLHADVVHVNREEEATFFSAGVSVPVNGHLRPRLMVGTSTGNRAILPDLALALSVQITPGDDSGWIITPGLSYRHFRNGDSATIASLGVTRYFSMSWDRGGYYAAQASVSTSLTDSEAMRASVTAGLQTVRRNGVIVGLSAEAGRLITDPANATDYRGRYFVLRPNLALPLSRRLQLITRGELADTETFDAIGGLLGLKVEF